MPYITEEDRQGIHEEIGIFEPHNGGELQYAIALLIQRHYEWLQSKKGSVRYADMEAVMGALNGANLEHYRMVVAPYEDKKIKENGGVYNVGHGSEY